MKRQSIKFIFVFIFFFSFLAFGQVRLPRLIADGMVLQRETNVKVWGWASPNEAITLHFVDSLYTTTASATGEWNILLDKLKAGGPYSMEIHASNVVTIQNILIGDVWVCAGQSNMELPMQRVSPLYEQEIAHSENNYIRLFTVPQKYNFIQSQKDFDSGRWMAANPQTILNFSAAAYFFGKALYEKYHVPIGLINTSLGGSPAEAWMSDSALKEFPHYAQEALRFKDSTLIHQIDEQDSKRMNAWYSLLFQKDLGSKPSKQKWSHPAIKLSMWDTMSIPGYWADTKLGPVNGVVWFRKDFSASASMAGKEAKLNLGRIVDADSVFVNGKFVGTTSYQYPPRWYTIPAGILQQGKNTIVVRVISTSGSGGFVLDKPYHIIADHDTIDLTGTWNVRLGAAMEPLASQTFIRWKPEGLFNAMLAPLFNFRIAGIIWYQGESNATRAVEYRKLFPAMIRDWRNHWQQGNVPFLFVQLPNFMEPNEQPSEGDWVLLREAQLQTLSLPQTGMAVTIDIGEWNDIHPLDKKDVGQRLARAAQNIAYHDSTVLASGPLYKSMRRADNKIIVTFTNCGQYLMAYGDTALHYFSIAGADKKFVWAKAKIENNTVIVWNDAIAHPVAVRYAWADNPLGANLYNSEGLPASPFRTDAE
ncbi:MAG TPA: sialate O-acetylesterase [Bacteroidota bacterium]|nr:sialate O-acetylesterase [Bacteroidota bacterium]